MRFVLRRAGFFLLTLWAAVTLNFFLPRMMPGNPAIAMVGKFRGRVTGQELAALETLFGVDTLVDSVVPPVFVITSAVPYFWVGMMFILIFGLKLQWLPWSGGADLTATQGLNAAYVGTVLEHAVLPGLALLITTIGTWTLTMRNNMVTTLAEDYPLMQATLPADHGRGAAGAAARRLRRRQPDRRTLRAEPGAARAAPVRPWARRDWRRGACGAPTAPPVLRP